MQKKPLEDLLQELEQELLRLGYSEGTMMFYRGLRSSEARLLKVEDVDLCAGILSIHHSKKDNSRLVAMSDEFTGRCRSYSENVHRLSKGSGNEVTLLESLRSMVAPEPPFSQLERHLRVGFFAEQLASSESFSLSLTLA